VRRPCIPQDVCCVQAEALRQDGDPTQLIPLGEGFRRTSVASETLLVGVFFWRCPSGSQRASRASYAKETLNRAPASPRAPRAVTKETNARKRVFSLSTVTHAHEDSILVLDKLSAPVWCILVQRLFRDRNTATTCGARDWSRRPFCR
jgi:hypothetical protein